MNKSNINTADGWTVIILILWLILAIRVNQFITVYQREYIVMCLY